jgi:hypothetical protein
MGKIYSAPKEIKRPTFCSPWEKYQKKCNEFVDKVKAWAKTKGSGPEAGEEVNFPIADGRARYIIVSLKPVVMIHLDVADGYQYPYAHRLTASDIQNELKTAKFK